MPETAVGLIGKLREEVNINVVAAVVAKANGVDLDVVVGEIRKDIKWISPCGADAIGEEDQGFGSVVAASGEESMGLAECLLDVCHS